MTTATLKKRYNMADDQEVVRLITDNMDKLEEHVTYSSKKWEVDDEGVQILDKIVGYHENISASIQQKMDLKEENRKLQELCNERAAQIQEAKKVTAQIQAQLDRLRHEGPRAEEFSRAVEQLLAEQARARQNNGGLAQQCALDELLGLGARHSFETAARLRQLSPEAVRADPRVREVYLGHEGTH